MGPRATWAFCQRLTECFEFELDRDHPRILVDCNTQIPSRSGEGANPVLAMVRSIKSLANMGAEFVAVPCNQAHAWRDEVQAQVPIPWVDMIQVVSGRVHRGVRAVVLGGPVTLERKLYDSDRYEAVYPEEEWADEILRVIRASKQADVLVDDDLLSELFKAYQASVAILACTELRASPHWDWRVVSSLDIYAEEVARLCVEPYSL